MPDRRFLAVLENVRAVEKLLDLDQAIDYNLTDAAYYHCIYGAT